MPCHIITSTKQLLTHFFGPNAKGFVELEELWYVKVREYLLNI